MNQCRPQLVPAGVLRSEVLKREHELLVDLWRNREFQRLVFVSRLHLMGEFRFVRGHLANLSWAPIVFDSCAKLP